MFRGGGSWCTRMSFLRSRLAAFFKSTPPVILEDEREEEGRGRKGMVVLFRELTGKTLVARCGIDWLVGDWVDDLQVRKSVPSRVLQHAKR